MATEGDIGFNSGMPVARCFVLSLLANPCVLFF